MVQYIFTPWRDQQELLTVRRQLYPDYDDDDDDERPLTAASALQQKQEAVARVSMWMQRGNCPHLVESTALLEAAILSDGQATSEPGLSGSSSSYAVRAAYSAAFSRFVTGLLDSHQDKMRKMSMYAVAKSVGLPATFVELRHQATHEQLPSLTRLRAAAEKALDWIYDYYWQHLDEAAAAAADKTEMVGYETSMSASGDACRKLLMELFTCKDEADGALIRAEIDKRKGTEVVVAVNDIIQGAKDGRVLRKAVAFMRELMGAGADVAPVEQGGTASESQLQSQDSERDVASWRRKIEEDRKALERAEHEARGRYREERAAAAEAESPTWTRHDKRTWVPKPIGIV